MQKLGGSVATVCGRLGRCFEWDYESNRGYVPDSLLWIQDGDSPRPRLQVVQDDALTNTTLFEELGPGTPVPSPTGIGIVTSHTLTIRGTIAGPTDQDSDASLSRYLWATVKDSRREVTWEYAGLEQPASTRDAIDVEQIALSPERFAARSINIRGVIIGERDGPTYLAPKLESAECDRLDVQVPGLWRLWKRNTRLPGSDCHFPIWVAPGWIAGTVQRATSTNAAAAITAVTRVTGMFIKDFVYYTFRL
jgi:hypothetical protein